MLVLLRKLTKEYYFLKHVVYAKAVSRSCSVKTVLKNVSKFTGKHLCLKRLRPAILLKKRLWHRFFPVNLEKFLRTSFL